MTHMLKCPECGEPLQAPGELVGSAVQCPKCQHAFVAAKPEEPMPEPPSIVPAPIQRQKPAHVTGLGVMALIGGICAVLYGLAWGGVGLGTLGACCLWPGTYYSLIVGIFAITRGAALLGDNAPEQPLPKTLAVLLLINIINGDITSFVFGIIMLTFCNEKEVIDYLKKPAAA